MNGSVSKGNRIKRTLLSQSGTQLARTKLGKWVIKSRLTLPNTINGNFATMQFRAFCKGKNSFRLFHRPEPSGRGEVDGLDIGGRHGRRFVLLRHTHRP